VRKSFTHDRMHRCHGCGWRGWGPLMSEPVRPKDGADKVRPAPSLEAIDLAVALTEERNGKQQSS